jgi:error-prone DNA polymerase
MGFYQPSVLVGDARRHGIEVRAPDINASRVECSVEDGSVRLGLRFVAHVQAKTAQVIVDERERNGTYVSLADSVRRTRVSDKQAESLIQAGAMDWTGLDRRELLWQLRHIMRPQGSQLPLPIDIAQESVSLPAMTGWERLAGEYDSLGLSINKHPLGLLRPYLGENIVPTAVLELMKDGTEVEVAGWIACRQRPGTAGGIVFLMLEDEFGLANVIVYPGLYESERGVIRESFVTVRGRLQRQDGTTHVIAKHFKPLEMVQKSMKLKAPQARNFF